MKRASWLASLGLAFVLITGVVERVCSQTADPDDPEPCGAGLEFRPARPYLADRTALLFPEEDRFICKVETEPRLYGDVAVRVASAM
jgi:hypothetical protein